MKKLPLGLQSFEKIRKGNYLYVDKTEHIFNLTERGGYYFLSRPRRFGKSLTISTLKELYNGNKALFDGLWIEDKWDWSEKYPVLHISFNEIGYQTTGLEAALHAELNLLATKYSIDLTEQDLGRRFRELLRAISTTIGKVVILIDEYDKPIIDYLDEAELPKAKANQKVMKQFYSVLKSNDEHIKMLFITGVSRFSQVSIFSDLNNLRDITLSPKFSTLTGYTQEELVSNFAERLTNSAEELTDGDEAALLEQIKEWYNGYSWDARNFVYNPFSILNFFEDSAFHNHWFKTGTPTFLINQFKKNNAYDVGQKDVSLLLFDSYDLDNLNLMALLFQTGYLTIKNISEYNLVHLDYPNREVEEAMYGHLLAAYNGRDQSESLLPVLQLKSAFEQEDFKAIESIINSLFKSIPSLHFAKQSEFLYHAILHTAFKFLGIFIESEVHTSDGRIDAVVQTDKAVFLLEFKLDQSAEKAIQQIFEKNYQEKYAVEAKQLFAVGINFSSEKKGIDGFIHEKI